MATDNLGFKKLAKSPRGMRREWSQSRDRDPFFDPPEGLTFAEMRKQWSDQSEPLPRRPIEAQPPRKPSGIRVANKPMGVAPAEAHAADNDAQAMFVQKTQQRKGPFVPSVYGPFRNMNNPWMMHDFTRNAFFGFGDAMQGAMGQMMAMNLANQDASLRNKEIFAPVQMERDRSAAALEAERLRARAQIRSDLIRASALAKILGLDDDGRDKPQYTSNIGQGINFYPHRRNRGERT